ncbi:MAG: flagellar motor switch protein FliM [Chloroflexota bacterium]
MDAGFDARELSQSEIDALLSRLSSGEGEEVEAAPEERWKVIKTYDFRRPDKLSKDQMRTLQLIHETFGRLASSSLSAYLRTAVQLNMVSIEQGVYGEYIERMPPDTILHILGMEPLPGSVLIGLDRVAAMSAVDRLLGGTGLSPDTARTPTEIEVSLLQAFVGNMLRGLTEAWSRVVDLQPVMRDVVLDPRYVQVALRSDPVVVIALEVGLSQNSGTLTLCLPYVALEGILPKLTAQLWFASARRGGGTQQTDLLRQSLESVDIKVMVELGSTEVTLQELTELKVGDVVLMDRTVSQPLDLVIGGRRKFVVRPGMVGNKLAVQVVGKVEELEILDQLRQSAAV